MGKYALKYKCFKRKVKDLLLVVNLPNVKFQFNQFKFSVVNIQKQFEDKPSQTHGSNFSEFPVHIPSPTAFLNILRSYLFRFDKQSHELSSQSPQIQSTDIKEIS